MITYINNDRKTESYKRVSLEQFVEDVRQERYADNLRKIRNIIGMGGVITSTKDNNTISVSLRGIPSVCFTSEIKNKKGEKIIDKYNHLILLEINNLVDKQTAETIRNAATGVPHTLIAFLGATERSVKIVCKVQAATTELEDVLQTEVSSQGKRLRMFHANAYHIAREIYSTQLHANVDIIEPNLTQSCLMNADPYIYYNEEAVPVIADDMVHKERTDWEARSYGTDELGVDYYEVCMNRYYALVNRAHEECRDVNEVKYGEAFVNTMAYYCREAGLPIEFCLSQMRCSRDHELKEETVSSIFESCYSKVDFNKKKIKFLTTKDMAAKKARWYLDKHYQFRINILTGVVQYRKLNLIQTEYKDVTKQVVKTLCQKAAEAGLGIWDKDVERYVFSDMIEEYNPLTYYLNQLPEWDGKDRLTPFLQRVKTDNPDWPYYGAIWMRAMVANWMGKNSTHGNSIVPVLIGKQGGGKTSFCNMILPEELRYYYNDNISFKTENDPYMALSRFGLINIDEFDALSANKHPMLKYILSKSDAKYRPPYGKAIEHHQRFASFIATTNCQRPLLDQTGSRRFVCIKTDEIDFNTERNYTQIYAQIVAEIKAGKPYYFNDEDNKRVMKSNLPFMSVNDYPSIVKYLFKPAKECTESDMMFTSEVVEYIHERFPEFDMGKNPSITVGRELVNQGYIKTHNFKGNCFRIAKRE